VGLLTFNAAGEIKGQVTASLNGAVVRRRFLGLTVNPDCSGTADFSELDQDGNIVLTATVFVAWGRRHA